jgi:2-polyprenyl-3-methyl-5-hydroxy-6-metoxy-1,4-benzoquinol methylase
VSAKNPAKKLQDTTHYEEQYFEGGTHGLGYGHYLDQQPWRIEKAYGQIKQFKAAAEFINVNLGKNTILLDVGSGYGYLRKAAQDSGWKADGTDLSAFAAKIAKKEYGFNTFVGLLKDFAKKHKGKLYDIIVLADVIEHVQNPVAEFALVKSLLKPKGLCMVRTPNIDSVEAKVFGNLFYSLKSEHLHYFSPKSLALFAHKAGLAPKFVITQSHFFQGLLGEGILVNEAGGQGSDIFAILQNNEASF